MKVSIDLDGTLWQHMGFFRALMQSMQSQGHRVGILTGHDDRIREQDVALMVARGFPRPDFYFGKQTLADLESNGSHFKARIIQQEAIDIHFDDHDFGNSESESLMSQLGVSDRVVKVPFRLPLSEHFE